MKIACFYADLHPATKWAINYYADDEVEFVDTSSDEGAYWRAICGRWDTGHDLVIIEQDIQISWGMLESFAECPGQWCAFDYYAEPPGPGPLGFTRFRAALQHHVKTSRISPDPYRHWAQIAPRLYDTVRRHGYEPPHIHGTVKHHHDYEANPPNRLVRLQMTKVVCCYVELNARAKKAIERYAPDAVLADTSADESAYWRVVKENWDCGEDLIIVEQDIEIQADTVSSFDECDENWCVFPYGIVSWQGGRFGYCVESLGCTRFSAELQSVVKTRHISQDDYRPWRQVAPRVAVTLARYGYQSHVHGTNLSHHHAELDYKNRRRAAREARSRASESTEYQEYLNGLIDTTAKANYWDTRLDLPARRLPG